MEVSYNMWYNNLGIDSNNNDLMEYHFPYAHFYKDNDTQDVYAEFILKIHPHETISSLERIDTIDEEGNEFITLLLTIDESVSMEQGWNILYFDSIKIDPRPKDSKSGICISIRTSEANQEEAKVIVRYGDVSGPTLNRK